MLEWWNSSRKRARVRIRFLTISTRREGPRGIDFFAFELSFYCAKKLDLRIDSFPHTQMRKVTLWIFGKGNSYLTLQQPSTNWRETRLLAGWNGGTWLQMAPTALGARLANSSAFAGGYVGTYVRCTYVYSICVRTIQRVNGVHLCRCTCN